jgi:hypothetical protein
LEKEFTVLTCEDGFSCVDEVADQIGCETVGLLTHSSFDASLLDSKRIEKAVLCDPAIFPDLERSVRSLSLQPQSVSVSFPTLILKTNSTYDTFIPYPFDADIQSSEEETDITTLTFNMGHADLLDKQWSFFADKTPFLKPTNPIQPFQSWKEYSSSFIYNKKKKRDVSKRKYKDVLSDLIKEFFFEGRDSKVNKKRNDFSSPSSQEEEEGTNVRFQSLLDD